MNNIIIINKYGLLLPVSVLDSINVFNWLEALTLLFLYVSGLNSRNWGASEVFLDLVLNALKWDKDNKIRYLKGLYLSRIYCITFSVPFSILYKSKPEDYLNSY